MYSLQYLFLNVLSSMNYSYIENLVCSSKNGDKKSKEKSIF